MPVWVWIVIAALVVVAALVLLIAVAVGRRKRTERLKHVFGPEYERTVAAAGGQGAAEEVLVTREREHDDLDIRALNPAARQKFTRLWHNVQTAFVDNPFDALGDADRLVTEAMRERGYPVDDFEQRAADISIDHPTIVENYRAAHAIEQAQRAGEVDTETQREAFVHYRALFEKLLSSDDDTHHDNDNDNSPLRHTGTTQETSA
jgi:hypothetical protein